MNFLFLKTSVPRLEPEIEQFEVWSTFVGFFAICLVALGDRKLANDDDGDDDGDDDDDSDDIYIMVRCVSVCYEKAPFRTQRIWSFHTFIATFRTQRNWLFPCFLTLSVFKGFGRSSCFQTHSVLKGFGRFNVS